ncbi:acetyltransferase [Providencia rettgeri]|uniref:Acetyltransferase SA2342 n=1 Tax=Providencia rettgeri TaxID=587 RepID=A0A379FWE4_PRORE|nr:acetyltransferase [Providencia rettgeri]SUC32991.1 Putative acetyltransferase SA2342 [Providencia rettgeri]
MSTIKDIYIIGSSGHASVITELIEQLNEYKIIGFIDDNKKSGGDFLNYKILGDLSYLIEISKTKKINVAIGVGDSNSRESIVNRLNDSNIIYPILIHPLAIVSKRSSIAQGTIILAKSIVSCNVTIGEHCLLNHACCVDHDCNIRNFVTLCPNVFIAGNVDIGNNVMIGLGCNIIEKIIIGENTYIGAGSCVVSNQTKNILAYGNPCKKVREKEHNDLFFK